MRARQLFRTRELSGLREGAQARSERAGTSGGRRSGRDLGVERPQVGDVWEGTGTHKPRIRIEAHDEHDAKVVLVRSGKRKRLALTTIHKSYRLIERNPQRVEHYP